MHKSTAIQHLTLKSVRQPRYVAGKAGGVYNRGMSDAHASDHLANERTFLAWVRTGIALISFGVVIAKLRFLLMGMHSTQQPASAHAGEHSTWLGLAFAGSGLFTLLFAALHYEVARRAIEKGDFRSAPLPLYLFTVIIILLGIAAIIYLLSLS
jgi:putative membrane protein